MKEPTEIIVLKTCECGCGQVTKLDKSHTPRRFVWGHGTRVKHPYEYTKLPKLIDEYKEVIVLQTCECGCGQFTCIEKHRPQRFINYHMSMVGLCGFKKGLIPWNKGKKDIISNETRKKMHDGQKRLERLDPEGYKERQVRNARKVHKLYPDLMANNARKGHKTRIEQDPQGYHDFYVSNGKKINDDWKKRDSEGYYKSKRDCGKIATEKATIVNTDWDFYDEHGTYRSKYPYCEKWTKEFREMIRERDGNRCVITGMTNEEHLAMCGKSLPIHHWTYDKDETNPFYFVTVTCGINTLANKNRAEWTDCFNGIMEDKYCEIIRGK